MNIEEIKSELKMDNLYFSKCSIERKQVISNGKLKMSLEKDINQVAEHMYSVELQFEASKEDLSILIIANATFTLEANDFSLEEKIIEHNTVAIMFPFVRSQVTLMTSQPGMQPIVVPPINTAKM